MNDPDNPIKQPFTVEEKHALSLLYGHGHSPQQDLRRAPAPATR